MAPCTHPGMKRLFCLKAKNGLGRFALSALPHYEEAFLPKGKKRPRSLRSLGLASSKTKNKSDKNPPNPKHHEIYSRPATATNSRRRATKHVPRGSPYWHASSIDPGFVEISLSCIHTYPHCCCCAAFVSVLVLYLLASAASAFSTVICIYGFGVVRWCLTLRFT